MTTGVLILETSFLKKQELSSFLCFLGWKASMF